MPVKILVADDSVTMRRIMEMTFAGEDAEVVTVESGEAAVQKAQEFQPDVVFADASMNGLDGYGLAQAIKGNAALANTAVIVLASQHTAFDADRGRASGVDDHVAKPFDSQVVIDKVGEVLSRPRAAATAAASPAAGPAQVVKATPRKATVAFGSPGGPPQPPRPPAPPAPPRAAPPAPPARPVLELADEPPAAAKPRPAPAQKPAAPGPAPAAVPAAAAATSQGSPMAAKLSELGLSAEQVAGVLALSREVVEQVVWEVVPDLAETIIREEIRRLTSD